MKPRLIAALFVTLVPFAAAHAATTTPDPLIVAVPDSAVAVAELRSSVARLKPLLERDQAMQKDLAAFLERNVGVDLTTLDSAAIWSSQLMPSPTFAALLRFSRPGKLKGPRASVYEGVELVRIGSLVGASVADGLLLGDEDEVKKAILVALKRHAALSASSPLQAALAERANDLVAVVDPIAIGNPDVTAVAQQYGARTVAFTLRASKQVAIEIAGDAAKLQAAQALLTTIGTTALAQLKAKMDQAAQGDDLVEGVSDIMGYHSAADLWQQMAPRLVGNKLVSQYTLPDAPGVHVVAVAGVMAAVAIPAFMKYIRRSKTVEATMNVRKLADAALANAGKKKKARFPKSTAWTPAKPCCSYPGGKCVPDAQTWSGAPWHELNFSIDEPFYYQYRVVVEGKGANQSMAIEARGDLDCDGVYSLYRRTITVDGQGNARSSELYTKDEIE